jgi:hypothetical protein
MERWVGGDVTSADEETVKHETPTKARPAVPDHLTRLGPCVKIRLDKDAA